MVERVSIITLFSILALLFGQVMLTVCLRTDINEYDLGRIFEYLWHIIFGQDYV